MLLWMLQSPFVGDRYDAFIIAALSEGNARQIAADFATRYREGLHSVSIAEPRVWLETATCVMAGGCHGTSEGVFSTFLNAA